MISLSWYYVAVFAAFIVITFFMICINDGLIKLVRMLHEMIMLLKQLLEK